MFLHDIYFEHKNMDELVFRGIMNFVLEDSEFTDKCMCFDSFFCWSPHLVLQPSCSQQYGNYAS